MIVETVIVTRSEVLEIGLDLILRLATRWRTHLHLLRVQIQARKKLARPRQTRGTVAWALSTSDSVPELNEVNALSRPSEEALSQMRNRYEADLNTA